MKRLIFLCLASSILLSACSLAKVNGDEVGIFVKQPLFFGKGGTSSKILMQGSEWKVATTRFITMKSVPIKYSVEFNDLMTNDNTPIDSKAHIFIQIIGEKANLLYENYGLDWFENILKEKFTKTVRDFLSRYAMYDLTSNREVYGVASFARRRYAESRADGIHLEEVSITSFFYS